MRRDFTLLLIATASVIGTHGVAPADDAYDRCIANADGTNTAWAQCGGDWIEREDKSLNEVWRQVYGAADGQTKRDLLAEQRLWNAYKESACGFYANGDWGREGQVLHFSACRARVIAERTQALQDYGTFLAPQ